MKKLIIFILGIQLVFSNWAHAFRYTEYRPEAVDSIKTNGLGSMYLFSLANGNARRVTVMGFQKTSDGQGLEVELKFSDKIEIVNMSDSNNFDIRPEPIAPSGSESVKTVTPATEIDFKYGLSTAATTALQVGLIVGSNNVQEIERMMQNISKYAEQIEKSQGEIEELRVRQQGQIQLVIAKVKTGQLSAPTLLGVNSINAQTRTYVFKDQSQVAIDRLEWQSKDPEFVQRADAVRGELSKAKVRDTVDQHYFDMSKEALVEADMMSVIGDKSKSDFLLDIAKTSADVLVGLDPFTGFARCLYESVFGSNLITGQELTTTERVLAGLGVLTAGYAIKAFEGYRVLKFLSSKLTPRMANGLSELGRLIEAAGNGLRETGLRKINFTSEIDSKWGLTERHLRKHFFGDSKFALRQIDPGGRSEIWLKNVEELFQAPATEKNAQGMMDLIKTFPKSDGSGFYKMGVRLLEKPDGSFDLVTFLTNQSRML
jgi:hypothetical protein